MRLCSLLRSSMVISRFLTLQIDECKAKKQNLHIVNLAKKIDKSFFLLQYIYLPREFHCLDTKDTKYLDKKLKKQILRFFTSSILREKAFFFFLSTQNNGPRILVDSQTDLNSNYSRDEAERSTFSGPTEFTFILFSAMINRVKFKYIKCFTKLLYMRQ